MDVRRVDLNIWSKRYELSPIRLTIKRRFDSDFLFNCVIIFFRLVVSFHVYIFQLCELTSS